MKIMMFVHLITGMMVGLEFVEDGPVKHLVLDIIIVRLDIAWGDIEEIEEFMAEEE